MGDLYSELLVKKDKTAKDSLLKYGLIVLTVLAVLAGLIITPLALIIAVALGIACYFVIPKTDVEFEYLFFIHMMFLFCSPCRFIIQQIFIKMIIT